MRISQTVHEMDDRGVPQRQTITIEIEPGDDQIGDLHGLVLRDRLAAFLEVYGHPSLGGALDEAQARRLLADFGYVAHMTESRLNLLLLLARDCAGLSWREIGRVAEIPQATVRRRVTQLRREHADLGYWVDAQGLHRDDRTVADAMNELREATEDTEEGESPEH